MAEILWEIDLIILLEYMLMYLLFVFLGKIDNSKRADPKKSSRNFANPIDITYKWRFGY